MDEPINKSSFLGVGLAMTAGVVLLGFTVFAIARGVMNNAQSEFTKSMDSVSQAAYTDYDGTTITGVKVRSALEDFSGKNVTVLINTAALQKKLTDAANTTASLSVGSIDKSKIVTRETYGTSNKDLQIARIGDSGAYRYYAVYNALLDEATITSTSFITGIEDKSGFYEYSGAFKTAGGIVQFNAQKINWKTSGCSEFISTSANFVSKLIKDASGTTVGIVLTEVY